jgi:uncharacterized membrane protein
LLVGAVAVGIMVGAVEALVDTVHLLLANFLVVEQVPNQYSL